ncbi:hypothetical protein BJV77DRAFT_1072371 [Russula vinacea]|nr:hypothetical protein BJV77DRAFT_1072371 [Russula vinacea]
MSITLSLPNDPILLPTPSYSATSLDPPPSTSSSSVDSMRPKPERRVSLGVLESAKFRLSHDFARLVRSPSSASSKSNRTGRTVSTHGSRALASDYENEPHTALSHPPVDLDHHDMSPLFADPPPTSPPRRAKFYGFLSRSSSRSRSRSKGDTRPCDSASNEFPDLLNATTATFTSTSGTSDSHYPTSPTSIPSTSRPSRPLSDNTITTGDTITPKKLHSRTPRASRAPRHTRPISPHLINDSGIGVNEPLIAYDPRMPPPPVPASALVAQPTSTKEKRRSKPLFGLPMAPWSRPTIPKSEEVSALSSPPQSPRSRASGVSKIENWFRIGPPLAMASSRPPVAAPPPSRPITSPVTADPADTGRRPHSTPPRIHASREVESSDSERDGRCSPLLGLFTARGRGKQRERNHDNLQPILGKSVVGAPITRTRTTSREGSNVTKEPSATQLPSVEYDGGGNTDSRRSTSRNGHRRVVSPSPTGNTHAQAHAYHSRGHAHKHSHGQDARSHTRSHVRSRSHVHPARSHTHPPPSHHGTGSPPTVPHSPLMQSVTAASAASHSTTGTAATNATTGAPATGGTEGAGAVRHSAASSTASTSGERRGGGGGGDGGGSGSDIRERERERDRERSRKRIVAHVRGPVSPVRSTGTSTSTGPGRWEQREIELGLGLTWAPTKIRVREWTPGSVDSASTTLGARVRAGAGEVEGGEDSDVALQRQREMEQRVREREGARRTRERLAEYEIGFDAELIPLHGPSGLVGRVERLLDKAPVRHVGAREKGELLDDLVKIVHENEW